MVSTFTPKNALQKIPWDIIINERHSIQPHTWYTCPAGKKALVRYIFKGDALGASASIFLTVGPSGSPVRLGTWVLVGMLSNFVATPNSPFTTSGDLLIGSDVIGEITLNAGESIITDQSGGFTNASFNGFLSIQETPI